MRNTTIGIRTFFIVNRLTLGHLALQQRRGLRWNKLAQKMGIQSTLEIQGLYVLEYKDVNREFQFRALHIIKDNEKRLIHLKSIKQELYEIKKMHFISR